MRCRQPCSPISKTQAPASSTLVTRTDFCPSRHCTQISASSFLQLERRSSTASQVRSPKPCRPVETNRHKRINSAQSTGAHGNQKEDHRRYAESEDSARERRSLVSADRRPEATAASEDLKAQTRHCRRGLSLFCYNRVMTATSESACALKSGRDADADVFRTTTEHGITNTILRVRCGTLEDQGLILERAYHDNNRW